MTREDGFTVVEALVALVIVALGLTALFAAFAGSVASVRRAEQRELAVETARSLLEGIGVAEPIAPGVRHGRSQEGLTWRIEIARRPGPAELDAKPAIAAFWVTVSVGSRGDGAAASDAVTLTSLRLEQGR